MKFYLGLLALIGAENRVKLLALQFIFFVSAFLQVAGIASIAPFIGIINNPSTIESNAAINYVYTFFEFENTTEFLVAYALMVVALLFVGNGVASYSTWKLFKFSMSLGAYIQKKVYNTYLDNDYAFFAMNNSSRLTSQITQEIPRMVYMVVQPILNLISQMFIAVLIVVGLLIVDITIAIVATVIVGLVYLLIFKVIRRKVVSSGYRLTELNQRKLRLLNESIAGIKEVKLKGNEEYYKAELDTCTREGLSASAYIALAGDLPKFIVETIIFSAILALAIYILITAGSTTGALSIISLYAMAGYKLLPAAQTIYKSISLIKANGMVIFDIEREIKQSEAFSKDIITQGTEEIPKGDIEFNNVHYRYPLADKDAISCCSFSIPHNKLTAFVGASGAGKSTAVDVLLGLLTPTQGEVTIAGTKLTASNVKSWRRSLGYVAQDIFILDASFTSNIAFGVPENEIKLDQVIAAAKMANLHDFISNCTGQYDFIVGERGAKLSGGQKQRIGIARALYHNPSVLIFDEATSALDNITEKLILNDIYRLSREKTVIMIAHRLTSIEHANKILVFEDGTVKDKGTYNDLLMQSDSFRALVNSGELGNQDFAERQAV